MFMFKVSNKDLKLHEIYNGIRSDYRGKKNNCVNPTDHNFQCLPKSSYCHFGTSRVRSLSYMTLVKGFLPIIYNTGICCFHSLQNAPAIKTFILECIRS